MEAPIKLLKLELEKWKSAKAHSISAFKEGLIDKDLHESHIAKLDPIIQEYENAILALGMYKNYDTKHRE